LEGIDVRFYRQTSQAEGAYQTTGAGRVLATPAYIELELPLADGQFGVGYALARDDRSVWACVCLQDLFTPMIKAYLESNAVVQTGLAKAYAKTWPLVNELLDNGMAERYSASALTVLEDPDDATGKWFVASVVGNLPSLSVDDVLNDRLAETIVRVLDIADAAIREYRTWEIDKLRLGASLFAASVASDAKASAIFLRDNFGTFVDLLGADFD
jgi:hypothetical protein